MTQITLQVNAQSIELNPFVAKALTNVIQGFVQALNGIPQPVERIVIALEKSQGQNSKP